MTPHMPFVSDYEALSKSRLKNCPFCLRMEINGVINNGDLCWQHVQGIFLALG